MDTYAPMTALQRLPVLAYDSLRSLEMTWGGREFTEDENIAHALHGLAFAKDGELVNEPELQSMRRKLSDINAMLLYRRKHVRYGLEDPARYGSSYLTRFSPSAAAVMALPDQELNLDTIVDVLLATDFFTEQELNTFNTKWVDYQHPFLL